MLDGNSEEEKGASSKVVEGKGRAGALTNGANGALLRQALEHEEHASATRDNAALLQKRQEKSKEKSPLPPLRYGHMAGKLGCAQGWRQG